MPWELVSKGSPRITCTRGTLLPNSTLIKQLTLCCGAPSYASDIPKCTNGRCGMLQWWPHGGCRFLTLVLNRLFPSRDIWPILLYLFLLWTQVEFIAEWWTLKFNAQGMVHSLREQLRKTVDTDSEWILSNYRSNMLSSCSRREWTIPCALNFKVHHSAMNSTCVQRRNKYNRIGQISLDGNSRFNTSVRNRQPPCGHHWSIPHRPFVHFGMSEAYEGAPQQRVSCLIKVEFGSSVPRVQVMRGLPFETNSQGM
jgi:hypothetical protein